MTAKERHRALQELLGEWLRENPWRTISDTGLWELVEWSDRQAREAPAEEAHAADPS